MTNIKVESANTVNRPRFLSLIAYKIPFQKAVAIMTAVMLTVPMLAGCKQSGTTAQAAESGAAAQTTESTGAAQAAESSAAASDAYAVRDVKIYDEELTDRTVPLRFYKEAPHVAYMGIRAYFDLMLGGGLTVTEHGDGTFTLTNASGATAVVDPVKGLVTMDDMPSFENNLEDAKAGLQSSFKDSSAPYIRLREVVYEEEPQPVTFDLGALGIPIYGDGEDVWFPVSILSSWLTDIAQNRVTYNGKYLYKHNGESHYAQDMSYYDTEYMDGVLLGNPREEDLASYSYAELGFIFQYMYGYPGTLALDPVILREQGLDAALKDYGELGQELSGELSSRDMRAFWHGMYSLSGTVLEDGHNSTNLELSILDADTTEKYNSFREYTWEVYEDTEVSAFEQKLMEPNLGIFQARPEEMTQNKYYSSGDTAIVYLNAFTVDREAWASYYHDGGPLPDDTYGTLAKGLETAAAEEGIHNVVIDLSTNGGGFSDAAVACIALMTGRDYLCGYNTLSKQHFKVYFDIDRNLDGVFDEKDKEVQYNFHYGALVSNASFSCGNMFPFMVRDEGGVVIGEKSGGGACSIQKAVLSEGFDFRISGCKFKLTDLAHADLEPGIEPDLWLDLPTVTKTNEVTGEEVETKDYAAYGDLDDICRAVSEWFQ
jgi:hypothetical protein